MDLRIETLQRRAASHPGIISLAGCLPDDELLPRAELVRAMEHALEGTERFASCLDQIRTWIADRLITRGAQVDPCDIIITSGARQALAIVARTLPPGSRIAVGELTSPAAIVAFSAAGHELIEDIDSDGVDAHFVIDGVSAPEGIDVVAPQRRRLLASGLPIIVDEAYVELRFDGTLPRPLLADAPDRVWHIGTFSKVLCPGLGLGWLIPPRQSMREALSRAHRDELREVGLVPAALSQVLLATDHDARIARTRASYATRAAEVIAAIHRHLPGWQVHEPEGGLTVWTESDLEGDDVDIVTAAINCGVAVDPGCVFRPDGQNAPTGFRISFAHARHADLDEGIRRLARAARPYRRCDPEH